MTETCRFDVRFKKGVEWAWAEEVGSVRAWTVPVAVVITPLAGRKKSRGGVETVVLHRICHRQVHAVLTETELEPHYSTIESLKRHPELFRFLAWVKGKPDDFYERTRKSNRLKAGR
jgi:hypothetical protein